MRALQNRTDYAQIATACLSLARAVTNDSVIHVTHPLVQSSEIPLPPIPLPLGLRVSAGAGSPARLGKPLQVPKCSCRLRDAASRIWQGNLGQGN